MSIILYSGMSGGHGDRLEQIVARHVLDEYVDRCSNREELFRKLRQPSHGYHAGVFLASDYEELSQMALQWDLVQDMRIILILPDAEKQTIVKGHLLRPRYITYSDSNFTDVAAVLKQIKEASNRQPSE